MFELLIPAFNLATATLELIHDKKRFEYRDRLFDLKTKILDESLKPVDAQNHASLEKWYKELPLVFEAITIQLQIESASRAKPSN